MQSIRTVILGGGRGSRLYPLTRDRAKPSVPFAGKYRLIDITLSNCINSELEEIYIVTQYNSTSLNRHIADTYHFGGFGHRSVRVLAAQQTMSREDWYQGTADAVRRNLDQLMHTPNRPEHVLILSGDHLYRMDYRQLIAEHLSKRADITISTLPVSGDEARHFGILAVERDGRIKHFCEKPQTQEELAGLETDTTLPTQDRQDPRYLASMGIYLFRTEALISALENDQHLDFGQHVIPTTLNTLSVYAYPFTGYWKDIGTISSYYEASLALLDTVPAFDFYNEQAPIYTYSYHLPNAKINESAVQHSMLGEGSVIDHSQITHSLIGLRTFVGKGGHIQDALILGYDYYESAEEIAQNEALGLPRMGIGQRCQIRRAIIDKNARIGDDVKLVNHQSVVETDKANYFIRDSIITVPRKGVIASGTIV